MTESDLRRDVRAIFDAAVAAVDPAPLVARSIEGLDSLRLARRLRVLAAGKAALPMAAAAHAALRGRVGEVLIVSPHADDTTSGSQVRGADIRLIEAGHPLPDAGSIAAGDAARRMMAVGRTDDVILVLLSGGASALLAAPADGISLDDYRVTTSLLLECGASIAEINCVRAHVDVIKGGGLARLANARVIGLVISDVIGNDPSVIASGPLSAVRTSFADAVAVIERYELSRVLPSSVRRHLEHGVMGTAPSPLRPADPALSAVDLHIIADNARALAEAAACAARLGYRVEQRADPVVGDAATAGREMGGILAGLDAGCCLVAGGETTVALTRSDEPRLGGRNQEVALAAAVRIDGLEQRVLLAGGTDGVDGPTTAAGGIVDGGSAARMRRAGVDPGRALALHDSHSALGASGDLMVTGPTRTNVMDLVVALRQIRNVQHPPSSG